MHISKLFQAMALAVIVGVWSGCSKMTDEPPVDTKPPTTQSQLSFRQNILPILNNYGCPSCHGGTAGLTVTTVAGLLAGGDHGPAVIAGKGDSSILIKKLSPSPPFGVRMPQGGPFLSDATIAEIKTWIDQGAKDN